MAAAVSKALKRLEGTATQSNTECDRDAGAQLESGFFIKQLERAFVATEISPRKPVVAPVSQCIGISRIDSEKLQYGFFTSILEIEMHKIKRGIDAEK